MHFSSCISYKSHNIVYDKSLNSSTELSGVINEGNHYKLKLTDGRVIKLSSLLVENNYIFGSKFNNEQMEIPINEVDTVIKGRIDGLKIVGLYFLTGAIVLIICMPDDCLSGSY